jgi:hypothetical protein
MPSERTPLTPNEEAQFQQWVLDNKIPDVDNPDSHYDYRGFWRSTRGAAHPPGSALHFPDTFKQHGHPTFSVESQYSRGLQDGGRWLSDDVQMGPPEPSHSPDDSLSVLKAFLANAMRRR